VLVVFIGFRDRVGGDWWPYYDKVNWLEGQKLSEVISWNEPGYDFFCWVGANVFGGVYLVNFLCGMAFTTCLMAFCRAQQRPWLALVSSVPYLLIVVAMGYTRQSVAIGLAMLGIVSLEKGGWRCFAFISMAIMFHKSAVLVVPYFLFALFGRNSIGLASILFLVSGFIYFFALDPILRLFESYVFAEYESAGAVVRTAMNFIPGVLFLWRKKKLQMCASLEKFWSAISLSSIVLLPLAIFSSSTTAIDRVGLYMIPLQFLIASCLPDLFSGLRMKERLTGLLVISYNFLVLFTWLVFGANSEHWVPYNFRPFELL
jgi:hypothetical protein